MGCFNTKSKFHCKQSKHKLNQDIKLSRIDMFASYKFTNFVVYPNKHKADNFKRGIGKEGRMYQIFHI